VAIAIATLSGGGGSVDADDINKGGDDGGSATRVAENSKIKVVVTDVLVGSNTEAQGIDTYLPLDDGKHFVVVKFTLTNKMSKDTSAPALFWKLYTSDGQISTVSFNASDIVPDGVQGKSSASFIIPFEVTDGATPTKLVYDGFLNHLEIAL